MEAVVIGIPDKAKGEIPNAFIQLKQGSRVDAKDIIDYCRQMMAVYKAPRQVEFVDELPKSPTGKILKQKIRGKLVQDV